MGGPRSLKLSTLVLTAILLLFYGADDAHCSVVHDNSTDRSSLLDFKEAITEDPKGALLSWNDSIQYCMWTGVSCSKRHPGRVTALDLQGMNLAGKITPSLGNLTFLQGLYLTDNLFKGNIPDALTNCSRLEILSLSSNELVGSIPPNIGSLSNLLAIDLSGNKLTGNIPPTFKNITHLVAISLADNQLVGSIPEELGQFPEMQEMLLGGNRLSGIVPTTLFNQPNLQILDLSINMLHGTLPSDIGTMLPSLRWLFLGQNKLEGHIPGSLGNASDLVQLDLSSNYFTGHIPSYLGKLRKLFMLNLSKNKLQARDSKSWEFLSALSNCPLEKLYLDGNQLHGHIPNSVGNLSITLQQLNLGQNSLFGTVPSSIGKFCNLISITLSYNTLNGTIEKWIGALKKLQNLDVEGNNFSGPIPYSLGNLTKLTSLYLCRNQFDGVMPSSLGNFPQLTQFDLSYNNLQGSIPMQVSNLKQLTELHLSSNKLTGEIPKSLDQCFNLVTIEIDQNMLIGEIPTSFGNLKAVNMLNLSHNNLSGTIPIALIDLELLTKLDLSYNHLHGEIPRNGVFRNSTSINLEGNWGLCGGVVDIQMPLCPYFTRRSETKYYLVGTLVPIFGFTSLIMLTYIILLRKNTSRRTYVLFHSFGWKFPRVSYNDLNRATGNFLEANLIGRGSYGSVYRGLLTQAKIQVAIKVFDLNMKCADKSFETECEVLRSIRHRNLVPILTACSTVDNNGDAFRALIYEFMPKGNLDTWLHSMISGTNSKCLSLGQRASIAVGIADALAYLHHDCKYHDSEIQIVHCDLKPTNILLDDDMNAYLGDFGIARLVGNSSSNTSIGLKGTIGYIAPEYAQSCQASIHGDVYSFGIVLLEMLIGKRPTDPMFENELNLVNFVERNYPEQILHIIDTRLQGECEGYIQANITIENAVYDSLLSLIQVGLSCTRMIPMERMNIREVATNLHSIRTSYIRATKREQVMFH